MGRYGLLLGKGVVVQSIFRRAFWIPELPLAMSWAALLVLSLLVLAVEKAAGLRAMADKRVRLEQFAAKQASVALEQRCSRHRQHHCVLKGALHRVTSYYC